MLVNVCEKKTTPKLTDKHLPCENLDKEFCVPSEVNFSVVSVILN